MFALLAMPNFPSSPVGQWSPRPGRGWSARRIQGAADTVYEFGYARIVED